MKKANSMLTFLLMAICAISAAIAFFQIDSYYADKHGSGQFIIGGIVFTLGAIYFALKTIKKTNG